MYYSYLKDIMNAGFCSVHFKSIIGRISDTTSEFSILAAKLFRLAHPSRQRNVRLSKDIDSATSVRMASVI